jgi:subtilisin family serine protease
MEEHMAAKSRKSASEERRSQPQSGPIPDRIFAQASPRSAGGVSLFEAQQQINAATVGNFLSQQEVINAAAARLQNAGFEVLQITPTTINIAGSRQTYEQAFNTTIVAEERMAIKPGAEVTTATFLDSPDTATPGLIATAGTSFEDVLEGVAIEEPRYFMAPSMFAPLKAYWHLRMPGDVSLGCNADRAHRGGTTGRGIRVAMCDSGWFRHPYFVARGYRAAPVVLGPGAANPLADESGHGTGESANIFAVAPDVELLPVKMSFVNSIGAFNAAVALNPDIITCSWGSHKPNGPLSAADQALAAAIAAAVAAGIVVIFSAGNGHAGFPGQHPDVISAGGVFMDVDESLQASNYSSGFMSNIYPNRRVPDLSGLVGQRPRAMYIMLPLEPGDQIDAGNGGGTHPNGDETADDDGWAAFSGTSAAAPQLAGAAALVRQACRRLTPAEVRSVLMSSARDVTAGSCNTVPGIHTGINASAGPDAATGNGLVDAHRAVLIAKVRCLGPITPITPITPIGPQPIAPVGPQPITPVGPQPITPIGPQPITPIGPQPIAPIGGPQPITPVQPIRPIQPQPVEPPRPIAPIVNPGPVAGAQSEPAAEQSPAQQAAGQLSAEDVQALEELIRDEDVDLGL